LRQGNALEKLLALSGLIRQGLNRHVGGRIVQLLIKNPLCNKVVVATRRITDAFADPKVSEVVVNMRPDKLFGFLP